MLFGIALCYCVCIAFSLRIKQTEIDIHPLLQRISNPFRSMRGLSQTGSNTLQGYDFKFVSYHHHEPREYLIRSINTATLAAGREQLSDHVLEARP